MRYYIRYAIRHVRQLALEMQVYTCNPTHSTPLISPKLQYNSVAVTLAAGIATTGITIAFGLSQLFSFYYIPSRSMETTLLVGDVRVPQTSQFNLDISATQFKSIRFKSPSLTLTLFCRQTA